MSPTFHIVARDGAARRGVLETPHGEVVTPAFMPVGTLGAVKGAGPHELEGLGAHIMLSNLYHLALRPGVEIIEELGGLHRFVGWHRPILTDSGGYQIMSLASLRRVDDDGVTFRAHHDGRLLRLTPEEVVDLQRRLAVDIAMVLDECPPWPTSYEAAAAALQRTNAWARRARDRHQAGDTALFGIIQGSVFERLREKALSELVELDFDGYGIGGVSVGEDRAAIRRVVAFTAPALPEAKPRYLMGLGTPADIAHGVSCGVDLFDCVLPSRNARHGLIFTRQGSLRIKNARFASDGRPLDEACSCPACRRTSRAFLHHLFRTGEITGKVLATLHNVRFYLDFMEVLRQAVEAGTLAETVTEVRRLSADAQSSSEDRSRPTDSPCSGSSTSARVSESEQAGSPCRADGSS